MSYPTALPTRTTGLDPEGIGAAKTNLTPLNEAERAQRIPEDEYNRVLDAVVAICAILGEDGSVDPAALRVQVAGLANTTQTVTSSPATVSARFVVLDDDTHTSGSPGSLVMPPITEGAWHVIATPYEDVHYLVTKAPGDPAGTGPDMTIDSSIVRHQTIVLVAVESEGQLRWQYDETAKYLAQLYAAFLALVAYGTGAQVIPGTSGTVADALDVFVTNAGATVSVTLPDAAEGRRIRLHKKNNANTQTITLVRSAGDISGGGTINGTAGSLSIVLDGLTGPYLSFDVVASAALAWHVDNGVVVGFDDVWAELGPAVTDIAGLATRIDALEAGVTPPANIRNTTLAGPHTILAGEKVVRQGYAGAMAYTLPPAIVGAEIDVVKDTTNAGGITLTRAGSDTIHGATAAYLLDGSSYVTSATTFRKMWKLRCLVLGDWLVM